MIHNDIQNQLALLVKTSATPLIEVATSPVETPQWVPGQRLPAHVIASLPNGRFHVMVEDQTLDMNLPRGTQSGDALDLVYVSSNPRPTFALLSDVAKSVHLPSQQVALSTTGKLLGSLSPQPQASNTSLAPLVQSTPLLPGAPASVGQLIPALQNAISNSGLFYESHQAEWVMGSRPLESLMQEPQGRLSNVVQQTHSSPPGVLVENKPGPIEKPPLTNHAPVNTMVKEAVLDPKVQQPNQASIQAVAEDIPASPGSVTAFSPSGKEPVHPQTTTLVQHQLEMVDNRYVVWQGQVWPGQDMHWEIEEEGGRNADGEEEKTWHTRLHIDFPVLGGVTARVALLPSGVKVDFSVLMDSTMTLLQKESPSLVQSLENSGLKVAGLNVGHDGES